MTQWPLVQSKYFFNDGGPDLATLSGNMDRPFTKGNTVVIFAWSGYPNSQFANAFTAAGKAGKIVYQQTGTGTLSTGLLRDVPAGTSVSLSLPGAEAFIRFWVMEFAGDYAFDAVQNDVSQSYPSTTDGMTIGPLAPSGTGEKLAVAIAWDGSNAVVPTLASHGWFSALTSTDVNGDGALVEYRIQGAAGKVTAPFTNTTLSTFTLALLLLTPVTPSRAVQRALKRALAASAAAGNPTLLRRTRKRRTAMSLPGGAVTDAYVVTRDPPQHGSTALVWCRPDGATGDIFSWETAGATAQDSLYISNSTGAWTFWNGSANGTGLSPTLGQIYCVAIVLTGSSIAAYIRKPGERTWTSLSSVGVTSFTTAVFTLGNESGGFGFQGPMWNAKVWRRVLTQDELMRESLSDAVVDGRDLHLHWPLEHARDIRDLSGRGCTPTIQGTPSTVQLPIDDIVPTVERMRRVDSTAAAAGGNTPVSASDSGTGSDSASLAVTIAASDSGTGTQTVAVAATVAPSDSGTGADSSSLAATLAPSDSATGSDSVSVAVTLAPSDSGTGADSASLAVTLAPTDSATGSDQISVDQGGTPKSASDSATGSDSIALAVAIDAPDSATGSDTSSIAAALTAADSGAGADAGVKGLLVSDSGVGADSVSLATAIGAADAGSGSDSSTVNVTLALLAAAAGMETVDIGFAGTLSTISLHIVSGPAYSYVVTGPTNEYAVDGPAYSYIVTEEG